MLEQFLREEVAGKYEVNWRYEFRTNSIIVCMVDGLLKRNQIIKIGEIRDMIDQGSFEEIMVYILREMMYGIETYRREAKERVKTNYHEVVSPQEGSIPSSDVWRGE